MNHSARMLWGSFAVVIAIAVAIKLMGCAPPQEAQNASASTCLEDINFEIAKGQNCSAVVAGVAELTKRRPECTAVFSTRGLTLVCHDGGTHD